MNFGYGVGDVIAVSKLAMKVHAAYRDAPKIYRNISEEVSSLEIIINKAVQHFESNSLSHHNWKEGQEVLKGCQSVLEELNSLIGKYNSLASVNTSQVIKKVKLGTEDIATLRARVILNTNLLNGFIQKFDTPTVTIIYIMLIPMSTSAVNCVRCARCRHGSLMSLVYTTQTQKFH